MPKPRLDLSATDIAIIERAKTFKVSVFAGRGKYLQAERPTLALARQWGPALEKEANNGKKAMVYAIDPETDSSVFVPAAYDPEQSPMKAAEKAAASKPAKSATGDKKPAAAKVRKSKAGKPAKADGPSKSDIAVKMLQRKGGAARKDIVEACGGWGVDLKQLCARRGLKLRKLADGNYHAA